MNDENENDSLLNINNDENPSICSLKYLSLILGALFLIGTVFVMIISIGIVYFVNARNVKLSTAIELDNIMAHLKQFETIAYAHPSKSRSVVNAFNESLEYVEKKLIQGTKCSLSRQNFRVPVYTQDATPSISIVSPFRYAIQHMVDFLQLRYGGNGVYSINAGIHMLNASGCSPDDYVGVTGKVLLMEAKWSDCELIYKALYAEKAGARSILFFNPIERRVLINNRVRFVNWTAESPQWGQISNIPTFSISYSIGKLLMSLVDVEISITSNSRVIVVPTQNLICDYGQDVVGVKPHVIMAGSHLDSVPEGPGLNDNGSGSASLLEIALQFFRLGIVPKSRIRFVWFGAEEIGLLGARHYVRDLQNRDPKELENIALYLNFDMLASPNFISGIHDGNTSPNPVIRASSSKLTFLFQGFFNKSDINYLNTPMVSGSDFVPFSEASVPSGGLETGASVMKTMTERTQFGGFANAPHDPCYHLACDTLENINQAALEFHAKAAANVIHQLVLKDDVKAFLKE